MTEISVVVPLYNEEENATALHEEIKEVCESNNYKYEIIFIDDGSRDKTVEVCQSLSPVKVIELRKNFGQTAAMDAGIKAAQYEYIVTMDGDRQNDPRDIPKLVAHLENHNLDIVSGWRKNRQDTASKHFVSRGANVLRKFLINDGIHDSGCSLKIYRRECFENVSLYGEMHRFIPALLKIKGYKVGEVVVNHRARVAGVTKYNWHRTIRGFVDMISVWFWNKFADRPLHLLGGMGLVTLGLATIAGLLTILQFIQGKGMSETAWPLLTAVLFLTGIQLFIFGLMSDILIKNYFSSTKDTPYNIKNISEY